MSSEQQTPAAETVTTPTDREIHVERIFNAPRNRVFRAFTDPELIPQWWGDGTQVEEMDVRPGGSWRFVATYANGHKAIFHGTYREVVPPERIVQTFEMDGMPGGAHVEIATFEDLGERTRFTTTMVFDTTEARDRVVRSGMQQGMAQTYARLDALLATSDRPAL